MSQENVEIVERIVAAFQEGMEKGDPGAVLDTGALASDFEWVPDPELAGFTPSRGREGFVEFMRTWTEDFESWSLQLERLIDAHEDRVVALALQTALGKGSGVPVELHFGQVYEFENGQVVRIRTFTDPAKALEAAGLSE